METTTTPPRRTTASIGVAVVGQDNASQSFRSVSISPQLWCSIRPPARIWQPEADLSGSGRREARLRRGRTTTSRSDGRPMKQPPRHPPLLLPPVQPRLVASTRAHRPPLSRCRLHHPGLPPDIQALLQGTTGRAPPGRPRASGHPWHPPQRCIATAGRVHPGGDEAGALL
jgi:hypothetical protein